MKDSLITVKLFELNEDFKLQVRGHMIDDQYVNTLRKVLQSGTHLPEILIDAKTRRVVDGFNRKRAYEAEYGPNHSIRVISRHYPNEAAMIEDAVSRNASHGKGLTPFDRVYIALRMRTIFKLTTERIAAAMHVTPDEVKELLANKSAKSTYSKGASVIPLKRTITHMKLDTLTPKQIEVNKHLSGQLPLRQVNEICELIENDMWDTSNQQLEDASERLVTLMLKKAYNKSAWVLRGKVG
jgi:hypothetical protein